ncbi:carbohydrate-responsive element-binding protein isoform X2 [Patella vulgata]|uniref:carbohydrate-responsive element-binding protein isoform X2 n=1 Tax=Patella vulgata TaxID=6465 RepID=UPI0021807A75|nr:carbohydrate-responsive element-binding protein isoform X2 [Patella vulgata]
MDPRNKYQLPSTLPNTYTVDDSLSPGNDQNPISPNWNYGHQQSSNNQLTTYDYNGFGQAPAFCGIQNPVYTQLNASDHSDSQSSNHFLYDEPALNGNFTQSYAVRRTPPDFQGENDDSRDSPLQYRRGKRTLNPLPRHKRESHINAEYRRRTKIQTGFDTLKNLVPALRDSGGVELKESKSAMLLTAAEYCGQLKNESCRYDDDKAALKQEIQVLNKQIQQYQSDLPAGGVCGVEKPHCHLDQMLNKYISGRVTEDWKFWIFSFLVRPLFQHYKRMVSSNTYAVFYSSIKTWSDEYLSLTNLRPEILSLLRQISTKTSIMTTPDLLPQEAFEDCFDKKC